jgi:predicted DNA-binding transcriptional regulator AlpA
VALTTLQGTIHMSTTTISSILPEPRSTSATDQGARVRPTGIAHDSPFIDEKQLCAHLGISSVTATKWRAHAAGPPFIKVGRLVRYRRTDVEAWLLSRTVGRKSA